MKVLSKLVYRLRKIRDDLRFIMIQRTGGLHGPGAPEFDDATLTRFSSEIAEASSYLEYGSGGSTLLADAAGIDTLSVESDRYYAAKVREALPVGSKVKLIVPNMGLTKTWGRPVFGARRKGRRYAGAPFAGASPVSPDFVLVDGRYRVACALEVAFHAHAAGTKATILFDDYEGRDCYHAIEAILGMPERVGRAAVFTVGSKPVSRADIARFAKDQS